MFLPIEVRGMITLNIVVNTLVVPAMLIFLLYRMGVLKDLDINTRRSRVLPIIIVAACYTMAMLLMPNVAMIYLVRKFIMVALVALLAVFVVNFFWKISLHLTAMGGFVAMFTILNFTKMIYSPMFLASLIIIAGLLASARLALGKHTIAQVAAGFGCGFMACVFTIFFL